MSILLTAGLLAVHVLAFMNGANDVSKTVASLVGSRLTTSKSAVLFGAAFNTLGGLASFVLAFSLASTFSNGIVTGNIDVLFAVSVIGAAIAWIFIATLLKLPVSTTHSITGALAILGLFVFGSANVAWSSMFHKIVLPLLLAPAVSFIITLIVSGALNIVVTQKHKFMDSLHWFSAAAASFARGLQDTPKIVALSTIFMLALGIDINKPFSAVYWSYLCVAVVMGLGGLLWGFGVTKRLAFDITQLHHKDAFASNAVTATLVILGGIFGLPMSTTHVSSMAITGTGAVRGAHLVHWKVLAGIIAAWLITLPASGLCALCIYYGLRLIA